MANPRYRISRSIIYGYMPTGVKWLLIINTAIFVIQFLGGDTVRGPLRFLELIPVLVVYHFPWFVYQLFTYMFLHAGIWHLIFNMLALWMFGTPLEQTWGTQRFLKYYFICGIGAGLCDTAVNVLLGHNSSTVGASGGIYGLLLAFGVLFPDTTVLMSFLFPIKAKYMVMIYGAVALYSALGSGNSNVSNVAHLGGIVVGLIYLKVPMPKMSFLHIDFSGRYRQWKMQRAKKKFQVYMRKHDGRGPWVN